MDLNNKKILFITPKFYEYEIKIRDTLVDAGADVKMVYDNLETINMFYRIFSLHITKYKKFFLERYYKKKLNENTGKYDIVFVISGASIDENIITLIKQYCNNDCKFIMYQWDSCRSNQNARKIADYFDKIFTFDIKDAEQLGWQYRPLFFIDSLVNETKLVKYDVCFLCSWHSKRADILKKIKTICEEKNLNLFYNMKVHILFLKHKFINKNDDMKDIDIKDVSFKSLSLKESYQKYGESRIVVDFTHPDQTGLTMRTIECVGNRCKMVTNNKLIKQADFYDPNNILVYEDVDIDIPQQFIDSPYQSISKEIYDYYSLKEWCREMIE